MEASYDEQMRNKQLSFDEIQEDFLQLKKKTEGGRGNLNKKDEKKLMQEEGQLIHQQGLVLSSLKKKCEASENEDLRNFDEEMRMAQARYTNMKNDVGNHQNKEVAKMQTMIKNGGTMLNSIMGSTMFQSNKSR